MSDLIDRQKAIDIVNIVIGLYEKEVVKGAFVAVRDKIAELPYTHVELCCNCRWSKIHAGKLVCRYGYGMRAVDPYGFCEKGER